MKIITILLCLSLALAPVAGAEETKPSPDSQIIIAMVDSRPAHWWAPYGRQIYQYQTVEGRLLELSTVIKSIPDKRVWEKRHPIKALLQEGLNVGSGLGNALKLFIN